MNHILSLALLMIMHASLNLDAAGTHSKLPEKPEKPEETKKDKQKHHARALSLSTGSEGQSTTDAPVVSPNPETYQRGMPSFAAAVTRSSQPTTPQSSPKPPHRSAPDTEELPSGSSDGARAAFVVALRPLQQPLLTLKTARTVSLDDVKAARRIFNAAHAAGVETDFDSHATVDFIPKPDSLCAQRQEAIARLEKKLLKITFSFNKKALTRKRVLFCSINLRYYKDISILTNF